MNRPTRITGEAIPLDFETFMEAKQRIEEYSHPKRQMEIDYVLFYAVLLSQYNGLVQSCIVAGEIPVSWERFVEQKTGSPATPGKIVKL